MKPNVKRKMFILHKQPINHHLNYWVLFKLNYFQILTIVMSILLS